MCRDRLDVRSQVLEAVRALKEGVLEDIREGTWARILGLGLCAFGPAGRSAGSTSSHTLCGRNAVTSLKANSAKRFKCPSCLREMAEKNQSSMGRFGLDGQVPGKVSGRHHYKWKRPAFCAAVFAWR